MENEDPPVRIGPLVLTLRVFMGGMLTAVLVAVEYQTLAMLDMPISAALVSFDAIIATISNAGAIVVLRGGASFTGRPADNIRLSEDRAEWVKTVLLRRLIGSGPPADLADRARAEHQLQIAAIGLGERLGRPSSGGSPRDVEVFLCDPETGAPQERTRQVTQRQQPSRIKPRE